MKVKSNNPKKEEEKECHSKINDFKGLYKIRSS